MRRIVLFLVILLNTTMSLFALDWDYSGYIKELLSYSDDHYEGMPENIGLWKNTLQGRLNLNAYTGDFTFSLQSRHLLIFQDNQKDAQNYLNTYQENNEYMELDWDYYSDQDILASGEIDRLYIDWSHADLQITVGRQRIAWGTALVWNISDFFNPFSILDFDYEEKPGTDALRLQFYTSPTSQLDFAYSPFRDKKKSMFAARYLYNIIGYDFNLMAAWQEEKQRCGLNWSGNLSGAGFRGELIYTKPDLGFFSQNYDSTQDSYSVSWKEINTPYWSTVLSLDYTFASSLYLHGEYLYNGLGATENAGQRTMEIMYTGELSPARHSFFGELAYNFTPLLKGDLFALYNLDDHSALIAPSLDYSLSDNLGLYLLAFFSQANDRTEYSGFPTQYFLRLKYSF